MMESKTIFSCIVAFCVMQWSVHMVESAINAQQDNRQSAYAPADDRAPVGSSGILDSMYEKSRQLRCVTCYEDRRHGTDRNRHYGNYETRSGDDRGRSWYYGNYDRFDDRGYRGVDYDRYGPSDGQSRYAVDRFGGDRYGAYRYENADRHGGYRDDRYGARPLYDRYDNRARDPYERPAPYDRGESRGYGYDNRDRFYGSGRDSGYYYARDRYYDAPRYSPAVTAGSPSNYGGRDHDFYDRYSARYEYRHYRPWDNTYRGGQPVGEGYYYTKGNQPDRRYLPDPGYNSRCGTRRPNCPFDGQDEATRVTSGTIDSSHNNVGVSHTTYNTNSNAKHNESSKGSGSAAGWSYVPEDEQPSRGSGNSGSYASSSKSSNRESSSDQQSSGYGALLDRGSNLVAVEPAKSGENTSDSMPSSDVQKDASSDETRKESDNKQNS